MRITRLPSLLALVALGGSPWGRTALAHGEDKPRYDSTAAAQGASLYKSYCSSCHGRTGTGDGPMADQLRYRPADLTQLARRNQGTYPFDQVFRIIDGRRPLKGHGGTDMPVWGEVFKSAREAYDEKSVEEKITQLVHFLASIQNRREAAR